VIHQSPFIRALVSVPLLTLMAWGQQAPLPDSSPDQFAQALPEASPEASPEAQVVPSPTPRPNAPMESLENALRQNQQSSEVAGDPNKPRTHRFTNQPVSTVLRVLAEEAMINYVEPALNPEERISIILPSMTPIQAFYAIADARGFRVVKRRSSNIITLQRSDINTPSYFVIRAYKLRYVTAPDMAQAVAGYLGIPLKAVASTNPAYPPVSNGQGGSAAYAGAPQVNGGANNGSGIQTLYSAGTEQSTPRFTSGLPFDSPLSSFKEKRLWIERSTNSIMVNTTPDEQEALAAQISLWDRPDDQLQINTYVVEVNTTDDLFGGVDWSNTLGQNGATFTLSGNVGAPPNTIVSSAFGGAFFKSGLILQFPNVQATIRALTQRGKLKSTNSPVTYTRTGEPVQIHSTLDQTIFLQTAATANVQATTTPYVFTSGLTIDMIPTILANGVIDLKINPALSSQVGTSAAQPGTTTQVPIISNRSATADVEVRSGEAAVIGGITEDTDNILTNGVPFLQRIPLLGYLFSTRQRNKDRTNLIILVWPKIIHGTFAGHDRVGVDEVSSLNNLSDLPGEPPPVPSQYEGKQPTGKRVYLQQGKKVKQQQ
jgi:type II secretory pathway component GspD/PulD (secretin)